MTLAGLVARIVGQIPVFSLVFVDAMLSTSLGSVVIVVDSVLANVVALFVIIALDIALVVGRVGIVASVSSVAAIAAMTRSGTISTARGRDSSLSVSLVEGLEALTGLGKG